LGAGTSLIVAGVLCLLVVSSIIAFRGFPGLGLERERPAVRLVVPAAAQTGRAEPAPIVLGAGAGPPTLVAPARQAGARQMRTARGAPTVRVDTHAPSAGSGPLRGAAPQDPNTDDGGSAPESPDRQPDAAPPPQPPTTRPGPVRDTLDRVRNAVPSVELPPAPPALRPVVDQAAGAAQPVIDQATSAVDDVNSVVDEAAGVVDDTVAGVLPR
jgi:hypothetical protein